MSCSGNIFNNVPIDQTYSSSSIGGGDDVYASTTTTGSNTDFEFKSIAAGSNVNIVDDGSTLTISSTDTGITGITNDGSGAQVFKSIISNNAHLRTVLGTGATTVSQNTNDITINTPASLLTLTNVGSGSQVVKDETATNANIRSIIATGNLTGTQNTNDITLNSPAYTISSLGCTSIIGSPAITLNNINMKGLNAGSGISLTGGTNTVTITNSVAFPTVVNDGLGSGIYSSTVGSTIHLRSILAGNEITTAQNANDVTINSLVPSSKPLSVYYNYLQNTTIDFTTYYKSIGGTSSIVVSTLNPITEGVITPLTSTTFDYTPAPRCQIPVIILVNVTTTSGNFVTITIKLSPILTYTNDPAYDMLIASTPDFNGLYQINNQAQTLNRLKYYDGSDIDTFAEVKCVAVDYLDAVIFLTYVATPNEVWVCDLISKNISHFTYPAASGAYTGGDICTLFFNHKNSSLYIVFDNQTSPIFITPVKPFDRNLTILPGTTAVYDIVIPSATSTDTLSFTMDEDSQACFGSYTPLVGDTVITQTTSMGDVPANLSSYTFTGESAGIVTSSPSGRLYLYGTSSASIYNNTASVTVQDGFTLLYGVGGANINRWCHRSPYGLFA